MRNMPLQRCMNGIVLRVAIHFLWIYVCVDAMGLNSFEDFEHSKVFDWGTTGESQFVLVSGATGPVNISGAPKTDATLGTGTGTYCISSYTAPSHKAELISSCFNPSNPKCSIQFSGYINIQEDEDFHICGMKQCDLCNPSSTSDCFNKQSIYRTDNWTVVDILLGYSPTPFDIRFAATLHHPGSFVALDDISIINCHEEPQEQDKCDQNAARCAWTGACVSRDQLCDVHVDCTCGDDEIGCEVIPPEGLVRLTGCNLDDGSCLWYNAYDPMAAEDDLEYNSDGQLMTDDDDLDDHNRSCAWEINPNNGTAALKIHGLIGYEEFMNLPYLSVHVPSYPKSAILRSVYLKPQYGEYGLCQIRFRYRMTSNNDTLQLMLLEVGHGFEKGPTRSRTLWERTSSTIGDEPWPRAVVDLKSINVSYVLQFKVTSQPDATPGEVMIHSITLGQECFSQDITFTTCNSNGPLGPRQYNCDQFYMPGMNVTVIESGEEAGVQTWTVPETQVYRIHVYGARGGWGKVGPQSYIQNTRGTKVSATFELEAGTQLYVLVGQSGSEPCPKGSWLTKHPFCETSEGPVGIGAGGGGGATLVYQKDVDGRNKILLLAGGGGGFPHAIHHNENIESNDHKRKTDSLQSVEHTTEVSQKDPAAMMMDNANAESIFEHLEGAKACSSRVPEYWGGDGGFGAGGGGCSGGGLGGGGHGKGFGTTAVGLPGLSYVHSEAQWYHVEVDSHESDGLASVEFPLLCPCAYRCMWKGPSLDRPVCLCPPGSFIKQDGFSCGEIPDAVTDLEQESRITIIILALFVMFATAFIVFFICAYKRRSSNRNGLSIRTKKTLQILCPCWNLSGRPITFNSHVLPQIRNPPAVMHENSIYNRITTKTSDQVLNEIPRKHLKLVSELGQGAFGEVFYGLLSHMPMVDGDLPVAVKTLPLAATDQAEMDFLLEALIVSKFNHPNIVKYLGNCFDQHPHYLILELLEGGDLKSFLHYARPKRDVPSTITMIDLLRLSLDVARGCQHLEEKHFIHRDIAARNCLLTTKGPNRIAKIADFGMARDIYRSDYYKKSGRAMLPVKWMPPEAFLDGIFTTKTDVWSYGILLWELFSLGHMPYLGCSNEEVMNLVTTGSRLEPPAGCLPSVFDIMTSCWATVPETRPNFGLIISVLDRTIQDDETLSHGLPFYYTPPVIHSKRICVKNTNLFPHDTSKGACGHVSDQTASRHSKLQAKFEKEQGYLEPLISRTSSDSSASKHVFLPT